MIIKSDEKRLEIRENMRGGAGKNELRHIAEKVPNCKLFAQVTLSPGNSIGMHDHTNDTEVYYMLEGELFLNDNGKEHVMRPGDVSITGNGECHAIENRSAAPALMLAIVIDK